MMTLIRPKNISAGDKTYAISKFPALDGRKIIMAYEQNPMEVSDEIRYLLFSYVSVIVDGREIRLSTKELINNHVSSWAVLSLIEAEAIRYNGDPLEEGQVLSSLKDFAQATNP